MNKTFELKDDGDVKPEDLQYMDPKLLIVLGTVVGFCHFRHFPCKLTNVRNEYKQSVSKTHSQGRAFDISVRNLTNDQINEIISYAEDMVGYLGAITASGQQRVVVLHDAGKGNHLHFQVYRGELPKEGFCKGEE